MRGVGFFVTRTWGPYIFSKNKIKMDPGPRHLLHYTCQVGPLLFIVLPVRHCFCFRPLWQSSAGAFLVLPTRFLQVSLTPNLHPSYIATMTTNKILQDYPEYSPINPLLLPASLQSLFASIPLELMRLPEETLATLTRPTRQQRQLKISFWEQYRMSEQELHLSSSILPVDEPKIYKGICSQGLFEEWLSSLNFRAWFIQPQTPQEVIISELLYQGLDNLKEVLQLATTDDEGKPITTLINTQLSIVKMLDARKHGAPIQRIEQKTQKIPSPEASEPSQLLPASQYSQEELLQRLQQLEKLLLPHNP